jgi:DHA2 family metal-tetracycline-proton antiporter-like MFS transporter
VAEPMPTAAVENRNEQIKEKQIVPLWSLTVWLIVMNTTMFNVALPSILQDFKLTAAAGSWIVSGYSIILAISTVTYSRLSDYIPIRRLLTIGLTLLGTASILGFVANQFYLLLAARLLQAAGAGAVPGLALVFAGRYIPLSRRGKAMAMIASASSLGFGLGPVVGGAITQWLNWNFLFVVTGFVLLLLPVFGKTLPPGNWKKIKFDVLGGLLTGLGVTGFLLFLTTYLYVFLIVSAVSIFVLWRHIHRIDIPFVQPSLLKNSRYLLILFIGFSAFLTHFATLFLMPIMLSQMFASDPAMIGLVIFPGAMLSAFAAILIGKLIDRFGNTPLILFGQLVLVLSTVMFSLFSDVSPYMIMFTYMFMSMGFSALTSSLANENSRILPQEEIGTGMGMLQLIQFFGGAFGVAISGVLIKWQQEFIPEVIYRNIYAGLSGLLLISILVFVTYAQKMKAVKYEPSPK